MNYSNCLHLPQVHSILDVGLLPGHALDCDSVAFVAVVVVVVAAAVVVVAAAADVVAVDAFGLHVEALHS